MLGTREVQSVLLHVTHEQMCKRSVPRLLSVAVVEWGRRIVTFFYK